MVQSVEAKEAWRDGSVDASQGLDVVCLILLELIKKKLRRRWEVFHRTIMEKKSKRKD